MVKLFSIPSGEHFVYDAMSNRIISLCGKSASDTDDFMTQAWWEHGVYNEPFPYIAFPFTKEDYRRKLQQEIPRLTLEITQQCNMRCAYCVYSGNYDHMRVHGDTCMGWDTVKKSIDFYEAHNTGCADAGISFYGGEALLEFDLIKKAATYAQSKFAEKPLHMSISSNGILLTPEVAAWLSENPHISVTVTLNGPYHDRYRKLKGGEGSLDLIMSRLRFIKQNYPNVWAGQILLICNITSLEELPAVRGFYLNSVGKIPVLISGIVSENGNNTIKEIVSAQRNDVGVKDLLRTIYLEGNDDFLHAYFRYDLSDIQERRIFSNGTKGLAGSCAPFLSQLFVSADGRFQICEKVCSSLDLGDITRGWNMTELENLYEGIIRLYDLKCKNCWAQRLCTVCYKDVVGRTGLYSAIPNEICETMRNHILRTLQLYCEMVCHYPLVFRRYKRQ